MRVSERQPGDRADWIDVCGRSATRPLPRGRLALDGEQAVAIAAAPGRSRRSVQDWIYAYRDGGADDLLPGQEHRPSDQAAARARGGADGAR